MGWYSHLLPRQYGVARMASSGGEQDSNRASILTIIKSYERSSRCFTQGQADLINFCAPLNENH